MAEEAARLFGDCHVAAGTARRQFRHAVQCAGTYHLLRSRCIRTEQQAPSTGYAGKGRLNRIAGPNMLRYRHSQEFWERRVVAQSV